MRGVLNKEIQPFFPYAPLHFAVAYGIIHYHYTRFGRSIYAVGGDEESARLMGLPIARTRILMYTASGFCSAAAGAIYSMYTQSGDPATAVGFELDAIAAVVIGGTLLNGGVGYIFGTAKVVSNFSRTAKTSTSG